jgi:hypothetical protein
VVVGVLLVLAISKAYRKKGSQEFLSSYDATGPNTVRDGKILCRIQDRRV